MFKQLLRWLGFHVHDWGRWELYGNYKNKYTKKVVAELFRCTCNTCGEPKSKLDYL